MIANDANSRFFKNNPLITSCLLLGLALTPTGGRAQTSTVDPAGELPPDSAYVVIRDGHLHLDGRRVRFWGATQGLPEEAAPGDDIYAYGRKAVDRFEAYGFNLMRIWGMTRNALRQPEGYVKGDGSVLDRYDWIIAEMKRRGMKLWVGSAGVAGPATPEDVDILDDPETAEAWKAAVAEAEIGRVGYHVATAWDPRLEAIAIRDTRKALSRVNRHTGLRIADDPVFAVWELTNEQWWIVKMVSGQWQRLPKFFKDSLLARWHGFLKEKYGTTEGLAEAWKGLLPDENLEAGTVLLAPMRNAAKVGALNDDNPRAEAKFEDVPVEYGREDVSEHRARDVNEFFASLILASKQRQAEAFKTIGKSTRLSTLLWDTGIGYNGIAQLLHQNAEAVAHCAYIGGVTHYESDKRYPFFSGLEEYPRISLDVPWLEHNKVEGKPFFCYEVNIGSPAKFRTEFPYRLLFLASIQDWDIVAFHTLSGGYNWTKEDPLEGPISSPGHAAAQFNLHHDEVLISAMRAAGEMFKGLSLDPAPTPTTFIYGRNTLFSSDSMDYAGSYGDIGGDMLKTTYQYGMRIRLDPDREDDEIIGPTVPLNTWTNPSPLNPTGQMLYDYKNGWLKIDSPAAAAFTGFLAQYGRDRVEFDNGVRIENVSVVNPPEAPYPVTPDENYVSIGVASTDGRPLAECERALISAVSTSANRGLKVGRDPDGPERPPHIWAGVKVFEGAWKTPVEVSRVDCVISAPALAGMTYRMRDWRWNVVAEGELGADGRLEIPGDLPVFLIELERGDAL
ncbi:MAG: hypothetical protein WD490_00725 [Opitutales bacterium]